MDNAEPDAALERVASVLLHYIPPGSVTFEDVATVCTCIAAADAEVRRLGALLDDLLADDAQLLRRCANFHEDPTFCADCGEEEGHRPNCVVIRARRAAGAGREGQGEQGVSTR